MNLPERYIKRMESLLGDGASEYFAALDAEPSRSLRINGVKLKEEIPAMPDVTL